MPYMQLASVITAARKAGKTVTFKAPLRPVHDFGFIRATSSEDEEVIVDCVINEERYKVADNYKITLQAVDTENFGYEHYYLSDLESMMGDRCGFQLLIDGEPVFDQQFG